MKAKEELREIIRLVKGYMEAEREAGLEDFLMPDLWLKKEEKGGKAGDKESRFQALKDKLTKCEKCSLCKTRRNLVFGDGSLDAKLVFVGEAPGFEEDLQGLPFVGAAGKLLTKIIESMGLKREDVYICNVLKCRPANNRNPLPSEIEACRGHLSEQLRIIKPKVVCTLGKFSAQLLTKSEEPIGRLRGRFFDYEGIKLMPTFHPAYLLRNSSGKKFVWEDMKKIMNELGLSLEKTEKDYLSSSGLDPSLRKNGKVYPSGLKR